MPPSRFRPNRRRVFLPTAIGRRFVKKTVSGALAACLLVALVWSIPLGRALVREGADRSARLLGLHSRLDAAGSTIPTGLAARLEAARLDARNGVHLRIFKEEGLVEVWIADGDVHRLFDSLPICRFSGGLGPKLREGDGQSPEGFFTVEAAALNPNSAHFLSFDLGFPHAGDRAKGRTGSLLMVHGGCLSVGCYAMTDAGIARIYPLVQASIRAGHPVSVHAFPFRMTPERLEAARASPSIDEWRKLAEGWAHFERTHRPPEVSFCGTETVFERRPGCVEASGRRIRSADTPKCETRPRSPAGASLDRRRSVHRAGARRTRRVTCSDSSARPSLPAWSR